MIATISAFIILISASYLVLFVYMYTKANGLPIIMNLSGTIFMFAAALLLWGWLLYGIFNYNSGIQASTIPWYAWLLYLLWYGFTALLLFGLSKKMHTANKQSHE